MILALFTLGALLFIGCKPETNEPEPEPTPSDNQPAGEATYVGSQTCGTCHADQSKNFANTSHAHAFKSLSEYSLDKDYTAKVFDTANTENPGSAEIKFTAQDTVGVMMDHYVVAKAPAGFKSKYYRVGALHELDNGKFSIEPASKGDYDKDGKEDWGASNYTCGACHSPGTEVASKELGVSCESCHGPGSKHVAAQNKAGSYPVTADSCLACHPLEPSKDATTGVVTAQNHYGTRGFYASKHYTNKSLNSCLACHNPHNANKNGKMIKKDDDPSLCNTCHADKNYDQAAIDKIFWVNPVDLRSHMTKDHSLNTVPLSEYTVDETKKTMTLKDSALNKVKEVFPDLFK